MSIVDVVSTVNIKLKTILENLQFEDNKTYMMNEPNDLQ